MLHAFEINGVVYTTPKQIGKFVIGKTGNEQFFAGTDRHNHYDTKIAQAVKDMIKPGKRNGINLSSMDMRCLDEDTNGGFLDLLMQYGWLDSKEFKRQHYLNIYTLYAAQMIIRWLTEDYNFDISGNVVVHLEARNREAVITNNEIWKKYNKNPSPVKAYTRKIVLPRTQAVMEAEKETEKVFKKKFTRTYNGKHILDKFPEYEKETIRFYSILCKAVRVFRESLIHSGVKEVDELVDTFVAQKVQDYYKEEN